MIRCWSSIVAPSGLDWYSESATPPVNHTLGYRALQQRDRLSVRGCGRLHPAALMCGVLNEFHDAGNTIVTIVGTRGLRPCDTVLWPTLWNLKHVGPSTEDRIYATHIRAAPTRREHFRAVRTAGGRPTGMLANPH